MDVTNIISVSGYIIQPLWNKNISKNGLVIDIGYKLDDAMPARYFPTQGEVIAAKPNQDAQKGDTIYFSWNALSFVNGCISHPNKDNLFVLKHSYYAYRHEGVLYTMKDTSMSKDEAESHYMLLEETEVKIEEQITNSGIVLSGFAVMGAVGNETLVDKKVKKKLHGKICVLPKELPFDTIWNPKMQSNDKIEVGLNVVCEPTSDVPVEIDGKTYFRTRFSEVIYSYHD